MRLVGIADYIGDAGKNGEIFRGALGIASCDDNLGLGIGSVDFADSVAGLSVGGGGDGASVDDDEFGGGGIYGDRASLFAELALDSGTIGLRGAAAELFDVECGHRESVPKSYLNMDTPLLPCFS